MSTASDSSDLDPAFEDSESEMVQMLADIARIEEEHRRTTFASSNSQVSEQDVSFGLTVQRFLLPLHDRLGEDSFNHCCELILAFLGEDQDLG